MTRSESQLGSNPTASTGPTRLPLWPQLWPSLAFALVFVLVARLVYESMAAAVRPPTSDDGYYLHYMRAVHAGGWSAFPGLFDRWNATPGDWIYPPPSRVGFIVVSALWAGLFDATPRALQMLSFAAYLATCLVNYFFARRRFGEPKALFIGSLISFSPLLMGISRLALTDSLIALCMTTTVWLFLELLEEPTRLFWRILFMASLAFMVLVKELAVLVAVPLVVFVLYERFVRRVPHRLGAFALCFTIPALVVAPVFVLAAGNLGKLLETTRIVLASPATNVYAIRMGSGPWFRTLVDYMLFSPWPTLLAIGWFAVCLVRLRRGEYDRVSVFLAFLSALLLFELSFFTKNIRYTVVLELPIRVFSVLMLGSLAARLRPALSVRLTRGLTNGLTGAAVFLLCWLDWKSFDLVWVKLHGYDPVSYFLTAVRRLIPPLTH